MQKLRKTGTGTEPNQMIDKMMQHILNSWSKSIVPQNEALNNWTTLEPKKEIVGKQNNQ